MPTVAQGSSVAINIPEGKALTITTVGEALVSQDFRSYRILSGDRLYRFPEAVGERLYTLRAITGIATYTLAYPAVPSHEVSFRRSDSGNIDVIIDPETGLPVNLGLSRPLGLTVSLGDSRIAQIHTDGAKLQQGANNHYNWGNARAGNRWINAGNLGNSGDRTDQILARLADAIATGAGHLNLLCGVNDIAGAASGYTTANTVGPNQGVAVTLANVATVAAANMLYIIQRFLGSGGQRVTLQTDPGAENMSAAQIAALHDYNQALREMAETVSGVISFDLAREMHNPAASSTTTIRFKTGYAVEASGSGVHQSNLGAYKVGIAFATHISDNWPPVPYLPYDVNEIPSISTRNLLANPLFVTATGGTVSTGITGTGPGNWIAERSSGGSGTQTGTISVQAAADGGPGNEVVLTLTAAAAGDAIRIRQDATIGNVNVGDIVQGMARVTIDSGGTALVGVLLEMTYNNGTTSFTTTSFTKLVNTAIGTEGCTLDLKTEKITVASKSGSPFLTLRIYVTGSAAGAAPAVRIKQAQIRKRLA